jgi:hypothetical protein
MPAINDAKFPLCLIESAKEISFLRIPLDSLVKTSICGIYDYNIYAMWNMNFFYIKGVIVPYQTIPPSKEGPTLSA